MRLCCYIKATSTQKLFQLFRIEILFEKNTRTCSIPSGAAVPSALSAPHPVNIQPDAISPHTHQSHTSIAHASHWNIEWSEVHSKQINMSACVPDSKIVQLSTTLMRAAVTNPTFSVHIVNEDILALWTCSRLKKMGILFWKCNGIADCECVYDVCRMHFSGSWFGYVS